MTLFEEYSHLAGKQHVFPDGVILRVFQIKQREGVPWVTYEAVYQGAMPRRATVALKEFIDTYGHLFQSV